MRFPSPRHIPACIVLLGCALLSGCGYPPRKSDPDAKAGKPASTASVGLLEDVSMSPASFDPSAGDSATVFFRLREPASVSVAFEDEDGFRFRTLWTDSACPAGTTLRAVWNGRDDQGVRVPNEAYFPILRARSIHGSDSLVPILGSGGAEFEAQDIQSAPGAFSYKLDAPSRMLARVGFKKGAMLATPIDWKPRPAGRVSESWNGRDADNLQDIAGLPGISLMLVGYTLPTPCVLVYGADTIGYRPYRLARDSVRQKRLMPRALFRGSRRISPHFFQPRLDAGAPQLHINFPEGPARDKDGTPQLGAKALVRLEVDAADIRFLEEQYEICIFVDNEFFAEEEVGYAPYNWVWNLDGIKPGRHILTVNFASFKDRVGTKSVYIRKL